MIYKLGLDGQGTLIRRKDFGKIKVFRNWTDSKFRQMCILSGCDYLDSPKGIGLKKAQQLLMKTDAYKLINTWITWGKNVTAPPLVENYLLKFQKAEWTFMHQTVYDPNLKKCIHFNPIKDSKLLKMEDLDFLGRYYFDFKVRILNPDIAESIATGLIDPITILSFDKENDINRLTIPASQSLDENEKKRGLPWVKKDSSRTFKPVFPKTKIPQATAFKKAFAENNKFVVKKTLPSKSDYFPFKNSKDQSPASKRKKTC